MTLLYLEILTALLVKNMTGISRFQNPITPLFQIWNALRYRIKISENLSSFKAIIKYWDGKCCPCKFCQHTTSR